MVQLPSSGGEAAAGACASCACADVAASSTSRILNAGKEYRGRCRMGKLWSARRAPRCRKNAVAAVAAVRYTAIGQVVRVPTHPGRTRHERPLPPHCLPEPMNHAALETGGPYAHDIASLFWIFAGVATVVYVLVIAALLFALWRGDGAAG